MVLKPLLEDTYDAFGPPVESDIVDQHREDDLAIDFAYDRSTLSRPSSRLGFNRDRSPFSEDDVSDDSLSEEIYPTSFHVPVSQTHSNNLDSELDITSFAFSPNTYNEKPYTHLPFSSSHISVGELGPDDSFFLSDGEDSDLDMDPDSDSSYSDFDEDSPILQSPAPRPHVFTQAQEPDVLTRSKFSFIPSPFSPNSANLDTTPVRQNPARHYYGNHGYSRHALNQVKGLWAAREDEWLQREKRISRSKSFDLFDDILHPGAELPFLKEHREHRVTSDGEVNFLSSPLSPRILPPLPPLSIHPRRGDISALRDPYCAHIDRCFVGIPLWTMSKSLWMYGIYSVANSEWCGMVGKDAPIEVNDDFDEERWELGVLDRPQSVGLSDDSDSTLVESDGEVDSPISDTFPEPDYLCHKGGSGPSEDHEVSAYKGEDVSRVAEAGCSTTTQHGNAIRWKSRSADGRTIGISKSPAYLHRYRHSCHKTDSDFSPNDSLNCYQRWEVLMELFSDGEENIPNFSPTQKSHHDLTANLKAAKFFIPDDEEHWDYDNPFDDEIEDKQETTGKNMFTTILSPITSPKKGALNH